MQSILKFRSIFPTPSQFFSNYFKSQNFSKNEKNLQKCSSNSEKYFHQGGIFVVFFPQLLKFTFNLSEFLIIFKK